MMKSKFDKLYALILEDINTKQKSRIISECGVLDGCGMVVDVGCGKTYDNDPNDKIIYTKGECGSMHRVNASFQNWKRENEQRYNKDNEIDKTKDFWEYKRSSDGRGGVKCIDLPEGESLGKSLSYDQVKAYETKFTGKKFYKLTINLRADSWKNSNGTALDKVTQYKCYQINSFDMFDEDRFMLDNERSERKIGGKVNFCGFTVNSDVVSDKGENEYVGKGLHGTYIPLRQLINPDLPICAPEYDIGMTKCTKRYPGVINAECFEEDLEATVSKMVAQAKSELFRITGK